MPVVTVLHSVFLLITVLSGISNMRYYFDPRFPLPVRVMFYGVLLSPALAFVWPLIWLAAGACTARLQKRRWSLQTLLAVKLLFALLNICLFASVPRICFHYQISFGSSALGSDTGANRYLLFLLADLSYLICGLHYLAGSALNLWKEKRPAYTYSGQNLFFFGQII